jgi:hypothetical protein
MFEKYIMINEAKIICGQTSNGTWYCKELPANNTEEVDTLIGKINIILNKYNKEISKEPRKEEIKARGLK